MPSHLVVPPRPGLVVLARSNGWAAKLIRLGQRLAGLPHRFNHVAVVHHVDQHGTVWGIEGRPGGVGWVDMRHYLRAPGVLTNRAQPVTAEQGLAVAAAMEALLAHDYAWLDGIARDAARALDPLWQPDDRWGAGVPGHVVCSSAADWAYEHAGLPSPRPDRACMPEDWGAFIDARGWAQRTPDPSPTLVS